MMNKNDFSLFQKYCEEVLRQLNEECIESFRETKEEESRIKLIYEIALKFPIEITEKNGKDFEAAKRYKVQGNNFFANKDYHSALNSYNDGIIRCPQNSGKYFH